MKYYKSVEILSSYRVSSSPQQTQSLPQKRKAPLWKTFWRRFWFPPALSCKLWSN